MHLWIGDARDHTHIRADLLIANLHFQVLDQLTDQDAFYSHPAIRPPLHEGYRMAQKLEKRLTLLHTHQENFWCSYFFKAQLS